jgi:hypothetical protein
MSRKMTQEDIAAMPTDELESRHRSLVSYIERERRRGNSHSELETDACYFARELEWRALVKKNHEIYLQKMVSTGQPVYYNS